MTRRVLRQQLIGAWSTAIQVDYCNQRINSERSMQASFWAQLNQVLPTKSRRMFIEPRVALIRDKKKKLFYPDIVICNTKQVIAVVELKYQPRGIPRFHKDIKTLRVLSAQRDLLSVSNARYRGPAVDTKEYSFAKSMLFVWAGIHNKNEISYESPDTPLLCDGIPELVGCFLELHAETDHTTKPSVFSRIG